ncbi:MAG: prepilin-type N-terminal cleavage/methylation domain-containing protein [Minisyncoccia bacterium]
MRKGFTLIELLIATAIFTLVIVAFIGIFILMVGVQARQSSVAAVNEQSQFLLQKIQYYVELSSNVSTTQDVATQTLTLRMPSSSIDPTVISLSGGVAYLQQAGGALQPLTSNQVVVSNLSFTRRANPPGHDAVSVSFAISFNTSNIKQMFVQALQTSVARVSAATFDSSILPISNGTQNLGAAGQTWASVNGIIDFSGSNVGINNASPQATLDVTGGVRLSAAQGTEPGCSLTNRGTLWFVPVDGSGPDTLQVCAYNASGTLKWLTVTAQ